MTARDILGILDQVAELIGRLGLVIVAAVYYRRRALSAFDRELRRLGLPHGARQVLLDRYRDMIPLNPLVYVRGSTGGQSLPALLRPKRPSVTGVPPTPALRWGGNPEALSPALQQSPPQRLSD